MFALNFLASIAVLLITFANAEYDVAKYCKVVKPGTKLPSLSSCQGYYTCLQNGQFENNICTDGNVFDKDAQSCVEQSQSNCYFGLSNPCENKNYEYAYSRKGCNWYSYCVNGEVAGSGNCPIGQRFYAANSSCIYGKCDDSDKIDSEDLCEIMPDGIYFGDFENCRVWHKCTAMNDEHNFCPDNMVYYADVGKCGEDNGAVCSKNTASGPPEGECTSVNQVVADKSVCSTFYTCEVASIAPYTTYRWVKKSCRYQYFDVINQQCSDIALAKPYPGCDRCEFKAGSSYWVNAVDYTCSKYLFCSNGAKVGTYVGSCSVGNYFDETAQVCLGEVEQFEQYESKHGACQNYQCTDSRNCTMVTEATTANPEVTAANPAVTTASPAVTTANPKVTAANPAVTTAKSEITTAKPEVTTQKPEVTTTKPEVTDPKAEVTPEKGAAA